MDAIQIRNQRNIRCITFMPDGVHIIGADRCGVLGQWKVDDGVEVCLSPMRMGGMAYATVVSADGRWIVSGGIRNKIVVWNAVTQQRALEVAEHEDHVYTVDISSDSARFASGSGDNTVRIFDIVSGVRLIPPLCHAALVIGVKFSPDGSRIATSTHSYSFVGVYNAYSGQKLFEIPVAARWTPSTPLAWSSDGQQLFASSPGKITCFDTSTTSCTEWPIHDVNSVQVSIATNGKIIACSTSSSIAFWDYTSRRQIGRTIYHDMTVRCIAVSRDGRYLACGHGTGITIHSLEEVPRHLRAPRISRLPLLRVSDTVLESWRLGNPTETESILSDEIAQCSNPSHHTIATRALVRAHLGEWRAAMEDAETSLRIRPSPIGSIARSVALAGAGEHEVALDDFDFVLLDGDSNDNLFFFVIKSILMFVCHKRKQAISRLCGLINTANETPAGYSIEVLGNMYLKQGDYESAVQTLKLAGASQEPGPLTTISIIFNWNFYDLELIAWQRLCEMWYSSGSTREVGEILLRMIDPLTEEKREVAHGPILENIVTCSGDARLLAWSGKSSTCNSCLPNSPAVYIQDPLCLPSLEREELEGRTAKLRVALPLVDALVAYDRVTRLQPVRFAHFRLLLPCIVFRVKSLRKEGENMYCAETAGIGDVSFTTVDSLPLNEPRRLVFVNPWIRRLCETRRGVTWEDEEELRSDMGSNTDAESKADMDIDFVHASMIEEVPSGSPSDTDAYTRALSLIARLEQPFSALLLLRQRDGTYKRVAADHEIIVGAVGNNVSRNICAQVLEVV